MKITPKTIKAARDRKRHTQAQAAAAVMTSANTWARWERGENMPRGKLMREAVARYCAK